MKTLTAGVRAAVVGSLQVMSGVQKTLMDTSLSQGGGSADDDTLRGKWQNDHLLIQSGTHIACHVPDRHWRH